MKGLIFNQSQFKKGYVNVQKCNLEIIVFFCNHFHSAEWIASNLTPVFILKCINDSGKYNVEEEEIAYQMSINTASSSSDAGTTTNGTTTSNLSSTSTKRFIEEESSTTSSSTATSSTLNVLNGNVSFGSLCQSSVSK